MVLHTRGSIWRKARAGSTALIILPYLWLCRKTHMKIRSNLSAGESISMHGDGMMQSGPETFEVWSPRLFELFEVWKHSRPLSIWYFIYRCSDFVWYGRYSVILFVDACRCWYWHPVALQGSFDNGMYKARARDSVEKASGDSQVLAWNRKQPRVLPGSIAVATCDISRLFAAPSVRWVAIAVVVEQPHAQWRHHQRWERILGFQVLKCFRSWRDQRPEDTLATSWDFWGLYRQLPQQ